MPSDTHVKLTIKALDRMAPGDVLRDIAIGGFFAERGKRPRVSLKIQADMPDGRTVKMTLGQHPGSPLEDVRAEALRLLTEIKAGRDPRQKAEPPKAEPQQVAGPVWTVAKAFEEYKADLAIRKRAERTATDLEPSLKNLASWAEIVKKSRRERLPKTFEDEVPAHALEDWREMPVTAITREMCRDRHKRLSLIGEYTANKTFKALKTCLKFAKKARGYPVDNPVEAVSLHSVGFDEGKNEKHIPLEELRGWYKRLGDIPNQLRRLMHEIGVYTGLRPANLMACQKVWLDFDAHCLIIPARFMKGRRLFKMPMSPHIEELFCRALELSEKIGRSPWVFPTYSRDGSVIATQENKEDLLPQETGYVLRHTYSNLARLAQVPDGERDALLAHKKPGITGVYIDEAYALPVLILHQQRVTEFIRRVLETTEPLDAIVASVANQTQQHGQAQPQVNTDRLLDAKGLADMLGLSLEEVERMKRQGAPYIDVVGQIRYQFSEVLIWLRSKNEHLRAVQ